MAQALDFGKIKDSCTNLTSLAGDIGVTVEAVESAISKIQNPAWEGEASEAYRDKLKTLAAHLPEANRQLAEAVIFLASCADAYDQLSNDAVKKLKDLIGGQDYIDKYDVDKAPDVNLDSRYGEEKDNNTDDNTDTDTTGNTDTSGTPRSSGCSSSGCSSSGCSSSGCSSRGSSGCSSGTPSTIPTTPESTPETVPETTPEPTDITDKIKEIEYSAIDLDKAEEDTKSLFENKDFKYVDGYAMVGENYLIACDESVGKVGDVIKFTLSDGTAVTCIVAANTTDATDKENISFIIEKDKLEEAKKKEIIKKLLSKSTKIENLGNCKDKLGIEITGSTNKENLDMENYPKDVYSHEAAIERGTLVAKYLMQNGGFTKEQAAALVGVYVDENGCYPGDIPGSVKSTEQQTLGDGYGAGIASWTGTQFKQQSLTDAGFSTSTKIENLSLKEQCDMIIASSKKSMKTYYDALKRCDSIEDASATATVMTGGVGFSNNWSTHPTTADAKKLADYYASANDSTYGYSEYHHNLDSRRLETAKEILAKL